MVIYLYPNSSFKDPHCHSMFQICSWPAPQRPDAPISFFHRSVARASCNFVPSARSHRCNVVVGAVRR